MYIETMFTFTFMYCNNVTMHARILFICLFVFTNILPLAQNMYIMHTNIQIVCEIASVTSFAVLHGRG